MEESYEILTVEQKIKYLTKVEFLADLTSQELRELAKEFIYRKFSEGYEVIKQGERHDFLYILIQGQVEALVNKDGHEPMQISIYDPVAVIGEISLLTGKPAGRTIRCQENSEFLALDAQGFALMLVRWPKLYQRLIEKMSQRLNHTNNALWEAKYKEYLRSAMQLSTYEDRFYGVWGGKGTTRRIDAKIEEFSRSKENLLIIGESGTGRQMMAWFIHKKRFGKIAPFVVIDGKYFDEQWGDSINSLISIMGKGTLFIKEPNLISPKAQINLSKVINNGEQHTLIIGTIQTEPGGLEQQLTTELLECFNQKFHITPLRERKRDIPAIAQAVIDFQAKKHKRKIAVLDQEATRILLSHNYRQGNTTELVQVIERAFSLAKDNSIRIEHIFFGPTAQKIGQSFNLLAWEPLNKLLRKGLFLQGIRWTTTAIFILIISILLLGGRDYITLGVFALVWGLWWPALVIISPFIGRIWCTVCPFSFIMENAQKFLHLNRPVPEFVKKYDYALITFLFLFIFWVEVVTEMRNSMYSTVLLLLIIILAAIVVGIIFARHTWCKHLCPIGGLIGTASIGSLLEVRADPAICLNKCTTLDCYVGKDKVPGCPMFQHLPYLDNNLACKMCFNCIRNCPNNSVQLNVRIPAREVWNLVRINQGFTLFVGASLAILIPLNFFKPLQKVWAQEQWMFWFTIVYWGAAFIGWTITKILVNPNHTKAASKRVKVTFALIPLLVAGHISYQLHFIPGANSLFFGLGISTSNGMAMTYLPIYTVGQVMAVIIGLGLTFFTIIMVKFNNKKNNSKSL